MNTPPAPLQVAPGAVSRKLGIALSCGARTMVPFPRQGRNRDLFVDRARSFLVAGRA